MNATSGDTLAFKTVMCATRFGPSGPVLATDLSPPIVALSRTGAARAGLASVAGSMVAAAIVVCCLSACSKTEAPDAGSGGAKPNTAVIAAPSLSSTALAAKLCGVLRSMAPELRGMPEVGARAQLVMAIGTAFDADAKSLAVVSADIDAIASAGCVEVRAPLLAATRAATLQEAVR